MSDENLRTVSKPDPDNWALLQSFFLEGGSVAPPPSPVLDNWDVLESMFDLSNGNGRPVPPGKPKPPISEPSVPQTDQDAAKDSAVTAAQSDITTAKNEAVTAAKSDIAIAKDNAVIAAKSDIATAKNEVVTAAKSDIATAKDSAVTIAQSEVTTAKDEAITAAKSDIATVKDSAVTIAQSEVTTAKDEAITAAKSDIATVKDNAVIAAKSDITTVKDEAITAAKSDIAIVKDNAVIAAKSDITTAANKAITAAKSDIATVKDSAVTIAQSDITIAKDNAVIAAKSDITAAVNEAITAAQSSITKPNPPHNTARFKPLLDFLTKHKFKLLLGAIALIPSLLILHKISEPKPALSQKSIYVNPITGKDTNDGTPAAPFQTLPHAIRQAETGSNIYLVDGDYKVDQALSIPANTTVSIPANTTIVPKPFNDIDGHWAGPFIRALAAKELIAGYGDGSFQPDANLTRAEYAILLAKVFNLPNIPSDTKFVDVNPSFWAYQAIQTAYSKDFLKGFPKSTFQPNEDVQRVQVIAALVSGLKLTPTNSENTLSIYQDSKLIPTWAAQVATATSEKLIVNYPNPQKLNPTQSATRAETAVMMYQALVKQGKMIAIESPYLIKP
ncbi:MAG: S-layer homology domain-containing protein [Myxacorys californica WJT36-NPBG1]|jgi:hypothetical protein|nr:S-layer homology domain-containing protein [Myxacorys californica WJT36-NPBG1]